MERAVLTGPNSVQLASGREVTAGYRPADEGEAQARKSQCTGERPQPERRDERSGRSC